MGFTQAKTYDIEVWAPGVWEWLEVSSVSNFRDFQARRMNIRWRSEPGAKPEILNTLNGSSLGFPRTVAQARALDQIMEERANGPLVVVDVMVPEEELVRRLAGRKICSKCGANAGPGAEAGACAKCGGAIKLVSIEKAA
jgi:seryl-tRNA synthetase